MSRSDAGMMEGLLASRGTVNEHDHLCRSRRRQSFWTWSHILDSIRFASPASGSRYQGQYSPSAGPLSSQTPRTTNPKGSSSGSPTQDKSTTQGAQTIQQQSTNAAISVQGANNPVVLLGVKGSRITLELAQIDAIKHCKDNLFFWTLKEQYKQHRGVLRYWFSIWKLSHCDFVKVKL